MKQPAPARADDASADIDFRQMFADVAPLRHAPRVTLDTCPKPKASLRPTQRQTDSRFISTDALSEADEASTFMRPGQNSQVLRKLKRGAWPICAELDLHGATREEAQHQLSAFLAYALNQGVCVRIIHGRALGAAHGPILKRVTRAWLRQQGEVLAFCEALPSQGGEGALLVLLKNLKKKEIQP